MWWGEGETTLQSSHELLLYANFRTLSQFWTRNRLLELKNFKLFSPYLTSISFGFCFLMFGSIFLYLTKWNIENNTFISQIKYWKTLTSFLSQFASIYFSNQCHMNLFFFPYFPHFVSILFLPTPSFPWSKAFV